MAVIVVLTLLAVFALPWVTPVTVRAIQSDSQAVGFNNRIAVLGLFAGMLALFFHGVLSKPACSDQQAPLISTRLTSVEGRVSMRLQLTVVVVTATAVALLASVWQTHPTGDAAYFIDKLNRVIAGGAPYSQIEFSYGPLMLYLPLLTWRLVGWTGLSVYAVYYAWVALSYVLGVRLAVYVLDRVRLARSTKNLGVAIVTAFTLLYPTLGLNYSPLRYLLPYAVLVWVLQRLTTASRARGAHAILPLAGVLATTAVSPEMGMALLAALGVSLVVLAITDPRAYAPALATLLVGSAAGAAVMLASAGATTLRAFTGGAYAFPVLPALPALVLVGAALLSARHTGCAAGTRSHEGAALQLGWLVLAAALLTPALGRADFVHVFWNGLGVIVLCAAAIENTHGRGTPYLAVVGAIFLCMMAVYLSTAFVPQIRSAYTSHWTARRESASAGEKAAALRIAALPALAYPGHLQGEIGARLTTSDSLVPMYAPPAGALAGDDLRLISEQMSRAQHVALPTAMLDSYLAAAESATPDSDGVVMVVPTVVGGDLYRILLGFPARFRGRNAVLSPTVTFGLLLQRDWIAYETIEGYTLLRRKDR